ncbi:peroxiredoxin family protein [Maridesulfovibrio frigidus]|uniref:peroxiredoxin family protein n=1 Tax=Maridesulfovibrio frigidus TaxID=340956 RepID=UPI0004E1F607|nr:TlpA disulfide reductase family protein [Maridesulfovibrio frigidus]
MLKYLLPLCISIFLLAGAAFAEPIKTGESFPDVTLTGNQTSAQQSYLGLSGNGPWKLTDIKADYVVIEIFSMYCPHCQAEAPMVNELFTALKKSKSADTIKLIGVGVGNSNFEINFFRKKFQVELPLFDDLDFKIHAETGAPGTPHFFLIKLDGKNKPQTALSFAGRMESPTQFLKTLQDAAK